MATSLGPGIAAGIGGTLASLDQVKGIAVYVTVASTVSAILGALVIPRLFPHPPAATCPPCPPCECLCASTCVPVPPSGA